jgi:hypothetical protein
VASGLSRLTWEAVPHADAYSVTRADLSSLAAAEYGPCAARGLTTLAWDDPTLPPAGRGFAYMVQAENLDCGMGSLGFRSSEQERSLVSPLACPALAHLDVHAASESSVYGTQSGGLGEVASSDDGRLVLTEVRSTQGNPQSRFSRLEHRWTIPAVPAACVELHVEGFRGGNPEGDDFRFEASLDGGSTFLPVVLGSLPLAEDNADMAGPLPGTAGGSLVVRVVDTDRTPGHLALDTLSLDELFVRFVP